MPIVSASARAKLRVLMGSRSRRACVRRGARPLPRERLALSRPPCLEDEGLELVVLGRHRASVFLDAPEDLVRALPGSGFFDADEPGPLESRRKRGGIVDELVSPSPDEMVDDVDRLRPADVGPS